MAWVQGNGGVGTGTQLQVAFLSNNTAANFLFAGLNANTTLGADAVTDSRNSYTQDNVVVSNTDSGGSPWSSPNCGAGANTVSVSGQGNITRGLVVGEWSGMALSSPLDQKASATGFSSAPASGNTPTTTNANDLLIGFVAAGNSAAQPWTVGTNYTERQDIAGSATNKPVYLEERIVSATGAYSAAATANSDSNWTCFVLAYKGLPPTIVLTGTVTASITEADIVAGGKTVILTVTDDTFVPASGFSDISFVNNALGGTTTTTSFSITLPTTQSGDVLILEYVHRGTGQGTNIGAGTNGLSWTNKHDQLFSSSAFSGHTWWTRATGDHNGQTVTGDGFTNSCAAIVTIYRGTVASGDPLADATIVGEENASGNETQAEITTASDKAWVVLVVVNSPDLAIATQACTSPGVLTERAERLSTGGTDASIAHASAVKTTAGATGALTWTQTDAASGSWAYAIKPAATTPFDDARAAIASGLDSAQSESAGWDAKVKPNIPVVNVVRTSATVCTVTLQAQSDYDITATETVTATVPAAALVGNGAVVATPTFTVSAVAGIVGRSVQVNQAVNRSATW